MVNTLNKDLDVRFAFLHIAHNHAFFLLDDTQKGVPDYRNRGKSKGEWLPGRGGNVKLDANNYLLQLTGPRELKTYKQGMARPLLIKLDEASTFKDIDYLAQQIYSFAHLSWRSFFPSSTPVTILYSQLIAQLLGNLRDISFWDSDNILNKLRFSRWFL